MQIIKILVDTDHTLTIECESHCVDDNGLEIFNEDLTLKALYMLNNIIGFTVSYKE